MFTGRIAWYSYSNADFLVAGKLFGQAGLGAYTIAWNLASLPVEKITSLVTQVTPAFLSAVQHDRAALRRGPYLAPDIRGLADESRAAVAVTDDAILRVKEMIVSGELKPGDRLPREADLAEGFLIGNSVRGLIRARLRS